MKSALKTRRFESREEWLAWRLGKLTGAGVYSTITLKGGATKPGIWRLVAESLIGTAALNDDENAMARGHRLEPEAIERFRNETGKKVDDSLIGWEREDDSRMAVSPDGVIGKTEAVEVKCLGASKHVEALYTRKIPSNTYGYEQQAIQYFIVNEGLKNLYYVFYHPDFPTGMDFFYLTFTRKEMQKKIDGYLILEREALSTVRRIVNELSLYSPLEVEAMRKGHEELLAEDDITNVTENV